MRKPPCGLADLNGEIFQMKCTDQERNTPDTVNFTLISVNAEQKVISHKLKLASRLGSLLGVFKGRMEVKFAQSLVDQLTQGKPATGFGKAVNTQ